MVLPSLDERGVREGIPSADSPAATVEQHLIAAVTQFTKLETENKSEMEKLFSALSSPFKISNKPCETQRAQVLQCFQAMMSQTTKTTLGTNSDSNNNDLRNDSRTSGGGTNAGGSDAAVGSGDGASASVETGRIAFPALTYEQALRMPIHKCYEAALLYQRCVDKSVLTEHAQLSGRFRKEEL